LRLRRLSLGLTQADLAALTGLSREQVGRLEVGECVPGWDTVRVGAWPSCCPSPTVWLHRG
jgi:predicted transcriptional regulator